MSERTPRIGDIVWYRLDRRKDGRHPQGQEVHAALITAVHTASLVNLAVFVDEPEGGFGGTVGFRTSVRFGNPDLAGSWFWRPGEESAPPLRTINVKVG